MSTDHILVEQGSPAALDLMRRGYACGAVLGHAFRASPGRTPFSEVCPLWRYSYAAGEGGAHLFTPGNDRVTGMTHGGGGHPTRVHRVVPSSEWDHAMRTPVAMATAAQVPDGSPGLRLTDR